MGWAEKRGRGWRWRYNVGGTIASQSGFATKAEAERWGAAIATDQARGTFIDPRGGDITLGDWIDVWTESRSGLKTRTIKDHRPRRVSRRP